MSDYLKNRGKIGSKIGRDEEEPVYHPNLERDWIATPHAKIWVPSIATIDPEKEIPLFAVFRGSTYAMLGENLQEKYLKIINSQQNIDQAEFEPINQDTWYRAVFLLKKLLMFLWNKDLEIEIPSIMPCSDGSIDLYWENDIFKLLVNITPEENKRIHIYGEDLGDPDNNFDTRTKYSVIDKSLIDWLKDIL